ncbi:TPA: hypothetical protein EYP66_11995 [Candidatus Poribacteria bacterium]|nr:hypothetical protein [Candidatus Poribacteria bacterium]
MIERIYRQFKQPSSVFGFASALTWNEDFSERAVKKHAKLLEASDNQKRKVWILFEKSTKQTAPRSLTSPQYSLVFTNISIPQKLKAENVQNFLLAQLPFLPAIFMQPIADVDANLIRVFLHSEDNPAKFYYNITEHFVKCLSGDLKLAAKFVGRTIFFLHYESQAQGKNMDILSSEGVDTLITKVYEPYALRFKDYLGKTILGFCVEPPDFLSCEPANLNKLPWTPEFPNYFSKVKGYNLLEMLPLLFYDSYDSASVRHDFWQVLTLMFAEICLARLRDWAHGYSVKLALTQPLLARSLTRNPLPLFKEADIPAVHEPDVKSNLPSSKRLILFKQAISIAGQFHKPYTLLRKSHRPNHETALVKWVNDLHWASIAGSNRFGYSFRFDDPRGQTFDVYLRRLSYILSHGQRCCNLLVLNPVGSLWGKFGYKDYHWINSELASISDALIHSHHDFDFGDEHLIAVFSQVKRRGKNLIIGDTSYSTVLIPPCINLQGKTVDVLRRFTSVRGKLIAMEPLPYLMDGRAGDYPYPLERLLHSRRTTILRGTQEEKLRQLEMLLDDRIGEYGIEIYARPENLKAKSILKHHRKHKELDICLLLNADPNQIDALIEIKGELHVEEWSLESGEKYEPVQWHADSRTYVELQFLPWQARLLIISN